MLIPDRTYTRARPKTKDHHLSVAFFGVDLRPELVADLRGVCRLVASRINGPIAAEANGIGIFNANNDGFAVVDLIDGIGTLMVRNMFEDVYRNSTSGLQIDTTHGFTPHITREYLSKEDEFYASIDPGQIDDLEFNFIAIGVWSGNERYEVSL